MLVGVPKEERTHYMMFEDTSEGTPISPAFATKEELVNYLVKHKVSYFGYDPAPRDVWERVVDGGFGGMVFTTRIS